MAQVYTVGKFMVEFCQLVLFTLSGNQVGMWGWDINWSGNFWKWLNYMQARPAMQGNEAPESRLGAAPWLAPRRLHTQAAAP